jgi:CheY-like chemotaxis protein
LIAIFLPVLVAEPNTKPIWSDGNRATILIIEDDGATREALQGILDRAGYSVQSAENGMHALQSLTATGSMPALILLDLAMPVMDGVTFLSHMPRHAQLAEVPVIIMSGDSKARQLQAELRKNVMEVLSKPINVALMMELVRKHTALPVQTAQ